MRRSDGNMCHLDGAAKHGGRDCTQAILPNSIVFSLWPVLTYKTLELAKPCET
jgi:hypothetical protein